LFFVSAYGGHALTKNNDLIYKPRFVSNVYNLPGKDKPLKSGKESGEVE